ncbi:hypothetical protein DB299_05390 (plasmid) [Borreliella bavariensis PBi]|uniref:Uncharacterized protein n=1 Tax=Borrelia garinii subsp. bavariensis (strain ATCC BAA-2496 / DSM 23469 / PBi) TaxID=290434 RepID=A0A7I6GXE7_BORGP|nr:hypothetical protein BGP105 [Borreliella bavariensis PBi]AZA27282.1 hypothetical protein DB299_05390 [Borreliella bavariensis PBi]
MIPILISFYQIKLRLESSETKKVTKNSSKQIRKYAKGLLNIVKKIVPVTTKSLKNYI